MNDLLSSPARKNAVAALSAVLLAAAPGGLVRRAAAGPMTPGERPLPWISSGFEEDALRASGLPGSIGASAFLPAVPALGAPSIAIAAPALNAAFLPAAAAAPALAPAAAAVLPEAAAAGLQAAASVEPGASPRLLDAREAGTREFDQASAPENPGFVAPAARVRAPDPERTKLVDYVLNGAVWRHRKTIVLPGGGSPYSVQSLIRRGLEESYANPEKSGYHHLAKDAAGNVDALWANEALRCGENCLISSTGNWGKSMSPAGALYSALDEVYPTKPLMLKMDRSVTRPVIRESSASKLDVISLEDGEYRIVAEKLETVSIYEGFARHAFRVSISRKEGGKWIPILGEGSSAD